MGVLVTGASGFVGRHAAEALRDRGREVRCLVRREADAHDLRRAGFEAALGDLSDVGRLAAAMEGCEAVVHVAGAITARSFRAMREVNEAGAARIAAACGAGPARPGRFVLVSSLAAAGPSRGGVPVREDDPPRPVSRYGWSKLLGERAVRKALPPETSLTIVRPPAVFGPRDRGILAFYAAAARGIRPRVGLRRRDLSMVYGPDLAAAIATAVGSHRAAGRTYHVADPRPVSLDQALEWIAEAVGRSGPRITIPEAVVRAAGFVAEEVARFRGRLPEFSRDKVAEFLADGWVCDASRACDELEWAPVRPLRESMAETAAWYRREGWIQPNSPRI